MEKLIKDIVHGYIEFEQEYIDIINTSEFQRLRNIRQTSYSSLYPSSSHDRFSHSLGVYAYGKYAFSNFEKNVKIDFANKPELANINWEQKKRVFLYACLLHDVGHAPFSHTGEYFYLAKRASNTTLARDQFIYQELVDAVNVGTFTSDFNEKQLKPKSEVAAPHEIMSATIGIKKFMKNRPSEEKDLFARMIIGLRYGNNSTFELGINNALIQLLNSSVIDVDRLDYLARDRIMTGFEGTQIDTDRLLASVCLTNSSLDTANPDYHLGFYKNALSVIENVVVAHDEERRWIQSHAVILYDSFLVQRSIQIIEGEYYRENNDIFSEEALSTQGVVIDIRKDEGADEGKDEEYYDLHIRLLCDADIIFLAKQIPTENFNRGLIDEYFSREDRKKAIWKSEVEYDLMLREIGDTDRRRVLSWLDSLVENLRDKDEFFESHEIIINEQQEQNIKKKTIEKAALGETEAEHAKRFEENILKKMNVFRVLASRYGIKYDFVIIYTKPFGSNVKKLISDDVLIKYKNFDLPKPVGVIMNTYALNEHSVFKNDSTMKRIYFIYYKRKDEEIIQSLDFIQRLNNAIVDNG